MTTRPTGTPLVGRSVPRGEDERLLRGLGRFMADVNEPGCLHARFVRSAVAHGTIQRIDAEAALSMDGVVAVLSAEDLPHRPLVAAVKIDGLARTPQPALAGDRVRYVGEPVAIVLADHPAVAEDAADLVWVDVDPLPAVLDATDTEHIDDTVLFPEVGTNRIYRGIRSHGDTAMAFDTAVHVVRTTFTSSRSAAVPLECRGCLAMWDVGKGRLEFCCSTQSPHLLRRKLATCMDLGEHQIRVTVPDVGGAFGQKIPAAPEEIAVALASRHLGRPVKWVEDRWENLLAAPHAKQQHIELALAMDEVGTFLALRAHIIGDAGAYSYNSASALIEPYVGAGLLPGVYQIRNVESTIEAVVTNKSPVAPYRGVGWTATHTARELLIDQAARLLGKDPLQLRRANMIQPSAFPYESATGMIYDSGSYVESLDMVAELVGYSQFREHQRQVCNDQRYIGIGISPYVEPTGWGSEGARQSAWSFASHDTVRVQIEPSGQVQVACGTPSQGQGHATTLAQIVADAVGVAFEHVVIIADDTDATPVSVAGTRASRVAIVSGGAAHQAGVELRERLAEIAGALLEADPSDIVLAEGIAHVRGSPTPHLTVRELAEAAYFSPALREQVSTPELVATSFLDPRATYANGVIVATVTVDVETGGVSVDRVVAVEDCGTMINPAIVDGQVCGAVAQGIGSALLEHMLYDSGGQPQSTSFIDYLMPSTTEVPPMTIGHQCSPSPYTPNGVKGVGESGLIAAPAAVANAVADALAPFNAVIDHIPITPNDITRLVPISGTPHEQ